MPTILIDADGCPVVDLTVQIGRAHGVPVKILCDTAHRIQRKSAETLVFDKGADSVDFALVNRVTPGDIVITQDYGLATMCLARRARVLNQNGLEYTTQNIDGLLARRHENKKLLRAGKHPKGPAKRTREQDEAFIAMLEVVLKASAYDFTTDCTSTRIPTTPIGCSVSLSTVLSPSSYRLSYPHGKQRIIKHGNLHLAVRCQVQRPICPQSTLGR